MLYNAINTPEQLKEEFKSMNRDYFTLEGYQYLIDLFEEVYTKPKELDVIGICCDFNEYTEEELKQDYPHIFEEYAEELKEESMSIEEVFTEYTVIQKLSNGNYIFTAF